jgi:hypothetical protein
MPTLTDVITYEGKWYTKLTSKEHRQQVEALTKKLLSLAPQMLNYKGRIDIRKSGYIFIDGYPEELRANILKLISH